MSETLGRIRLIAPCIFLMLTAAAVCAAETPLRETIDQRITAAWAREKLTPSSPASDAEFVRRIYLDLAGVAPSYAEVKAFLDDTSPDKRQKLIDALLGDERYPQARALLWDNILFGREPPGEDATRKRDGFVRFLRERFKENTPYDQIVRALLLAEGNSADQGAPLFLVQFRNKPEDATVAVTRLFLGMQLQCARCHDHPTESWTQKDFFGMAAFFSRLKVSEAGKSGQMTKFIIAEASTGDILFTGSAKDQKPGMKGEPVAPKFLAGAELDEPKVPKDFKEPKIDAGKEPPKPLFSRKAKLAEWVTSPDNPYFARAAVNRVWAQLMGRGLVDPVDDFSPGTPASHPELLETLAAEFKAHKFDLKWLTREIVSSKAYQLSSAGSSIEASPKWYERARVRPLSAEELIASLKVVTGLEEAVKQGAKPQYNTEYFTRYFGEPTNGRGVFQGSIDEHLFLNNSPDVQNFTRPMKGNLAERMRNSTEPPEEKVKEMFLSILSRPPTAVELERFAAFISRAGKDKENGWRAISASIWVLMNTSEFRFNH